jgi:outer membrane protein insertion porin family
MPAKFKTSARVGLFLDMGGVYQTGHNYTFFAPDGITPIRYGLNSFNDVRRSVGLAVEWLAPLGLFRFSYGVPLNAQHYDVSSNWGDQTEGFQFSIGQAF